MSMKADLGKILFLILFLTLTAMTALAGTVKGTITDKQTKEPLTRSHCAGGRKHPKAPWPTLTDAIHSKCPTECTTSWCVTWAM